MKCGGNYDQMFRERGRKWYICHNNTIQLFTEKSSRRERKILTLKAEAAGLTGLMTEKTEGGGERQEAARPPPRSYSEFMRNLAAKYNTESTE